MYLVQSVFDSCSKIVDHKMWSQKVEFKVDYHPDKIKNMLDGGFGRGVQKIYICKKKTIITQTSDTSCSDSKINF